MLYVKENKENSLSRREARESSGKKSGLAVNPGASLADTMSEMSNGLHGV